MFISLCNATGGLSLPSHDTLSLLTTQSTFLERSFVYTDTRCCVQERLNNSVFCSRIFLLCASLKYDHILTYYRCWYGYMACCFPAKINRVSAWLSPEIAQLHLGLYSNFNWRNTGKQTVFFFFFFFYECYEWWRRVWWIINYK
jgi:hypothetical protein